jgi:hypothetical protein
MFQGAHGAEMNLGQEPANQPVNITAVVTNQKSMLITCETKFTAQNPPSPPPPPPPMLRYSFYRELQLNV